MKFKIHGCSININFLFAAVITLIIDRSNTAAYIVIASFLHEMGHIVLLIYFGDSVKELSLGIFGMRMVRSSDTKLTYMNEIAVAFAGPFMNIIIFASLFFINMMSGRKGIQMAMAVNLCLGLFNLLPIMPLDGGRMAYYFLCSKLNPERAEKGVKIISVLTLLPTAAAGFYILIKSGYNISLLIVVIYLCLFLIKKPL